ncbi:MAG: DUF4236 domain-containing protein [Prevotellaceae bacterium]|jgi:hypothetical protein|nr:DUF4236 domain-containing protein [Prevotellaceae bacterium]
MGIRFRKRVKILPGVKLNFSKSGMSTTIGGKGGSINIGKNGIYGNAGIPGTGIYTREKIYGRKKEKQAINEEQAELTGFSFGCVTLILSIAIGAFFGFVFGNLWLTIIFAPIIFICVYIARTYSKKTEEEPADFQKEQEIKSERVQLSTLFKYKSVIEQDTLNQLKEYQQMGAKSVNVPIGTLDELKRRLVEKDEKENP